MQTFTKYGFFSTQKRLQLSRDIVRNCTLTLILKGEPGLPGEAGMEGVPGPKVKVQDVT